MIKYNSYNCINIKNLKKNIHKSKNKNNNDTILEEEVLPELNDDSNISTINVDKFDNGKNYYR